MSFICHIHNYTEYNQQWNVLSAFNPSKCTHLEQWAADTAAPGEAVEGTVPCSKVSTQSWTIPAGAEIRTHNLGLQVRCSIHYSHDCPQDQDLDQDLDDATAAILCQNAHHTPAYWWRGDKVMKPIGVWGLLGGHDGQRPMGEFGQDAGVTPLLFFEWHPGIFNDNR